MSNKLEDEHSSSSSSSSAGSYSDWISNVRGRPFQPGRLDQEEIWWAERQQALEAAGYILRPRYCQGWKESWVEVTSKKGFDWWECEECQPMVSILLAFTKLP
jgi:hypothetical protein